MDSTSFIGKMTDVKKITSETFIREVETLVRDHDLDYMDAVLHFCEANGVEMETIASIIKNNPSIKSKVQEEAEGLHLLPKKSRLPL